MFWVFTNWLMGGGNNNDHLETTVVTACMWLRSLPQLQKHPAHQTQTYSDNQPDVYFFAKCLKLSPKRRCLPTFSLLASRQHGFLPRFSTLINLLVAEKLVTKWLDEGSAVDLIYTDFPKAFYLVNLRLLIAKLRGYGIVSSKISWAVCFLSRWTF